MSHVLEPLECDCHCHRNPNIEHCVPCCTVCQKCKLRVLRGWMNEHVCEPVRKDKP